MRLEHSKLNWEAINDGVMGGLSRSQPRIIDDTLSFEGELSLENNGGFASIRARLPKPLSRFERLRLTVSGDGRRYQLRLRENSESRGVAWMTLFRAGPERHTVELKLQDFQPIIRGECVIGARPLHEIEIRHLGFMLADREPGVFGLQVHAMDLVTGGADHG